MQGSHWTPAEREARLSKLVERNRAARNGEFLYEDATWMRDAYVTRGLTLRQVAQEASCSLRTAARWLRIHGIEARRDWVRVSGAAHGSWKGGPPTCPACGGQRSYGAQTCRGCQDRRGERNSKWRGDAAEYTAAHGRVVAQRGPASRNQCAHCGEQAAEWAYDGSDPQEKRNEVGRDDGPFSLDAGRYMPLCVRCHRRFDLGR